RLSHNILPTRANLVRRGVQVSNQCLSCNSGMDEVSRIFLSCDWVLRDWRMSGLKVEAGGYHVNNFKDWLDVVRKRKSKVAFALFLLLLWRACFNRNIHIYENK
ncbi:zf-RVT domain-containing protein, partial [Cephalotus follicularis]